MLKVQEFLRSGNDLDTLESQFGIKVTKHSVLPLVILNYDQIESPKTHPIVRECRGLVLHSNSFDVVGKSFSRFFNWGEVAEEMAFFDFSDFVVQEKVDGSLVLFYYFDGWHVNTRGSFAKDLMQHQPFTWEEAIMREALGLTYHEMDEWLDRRFTYVGEFCSPWNKVVRSYQKPVVYLLTMFDNSTLEEQTVEFCDEHCPRQIMLRPQRYNFRSIEEIQEWLREQSVQDATFEGVVIRDSENRRWKIKSATYLGLHRLKGDDAWNPKHLLPFVLTGEEAELLQYFPEVRERFFEMKATVFEEYSKLIEIWGDHRHLQDQKDFALAIKDKSPFSGLLFQVRKEYGDKQTAKHVREKWQQSDQLILKVAFRRPTTPA